MFECENFQFVNLVGKRGSGWENIDSLGAYAQSKPEENYHSWI